MLVRHRYIWKFKLLAFYGIAYEISNVFLASAMSNLLRPKTSLSTRLLVSNLIFYVFSFFDFASLLPLCWLQEAV